MTPMSMPHDATTNSQVPARVRLGIRKKMLPTTNAKFPNRPTPMCTHGISWA